MKNIIIYGSGRSVKSTLARMIKNKWNYNWIPLDPIRNIYDAISNDDSANDWDSNIEDLQKKWSKLIISAIDNFSQEGNDFGEYFIFEGWVIELEALLEKVDRNRFIIIGMGYPNISKKEKLNQILQYETNKDWTSEYSLKEKRDFVNHILEEDKYIKTQIEKFNIPFFDISYDREKVFKEIIDYLEKNLEIQIGFYEKEFYCLDNFSSFGFVYGDKFYPTVEHAYQSAKFFSTDLKIAEEIRLCFSADEAKRLAHKWEDNVVKNWDDIKISVMEKFLRLKLKQNPYVKKKLLQTKNSLIFEDSPVDYFWGVGSKKDGQNQLGKLWMKLREEIKGE